MAAAHRSMTSPFWPHFLSKQWETLVSRFTLKVRQGVAAMQRTRAAPLGTSAAQLPRQAQLIEDAGDGQLVFQMGKVEIGALADGHRFAYVVGTGRGDHWLRRRNVRRVARGLVFR